MCSSRASLNMSQSNNDDENASDGLSGGGSIQLSFNKENNLKNLDESGIDDQVDQQIEQCKVYDILF